MTRLTFDQISWAKDRYLTGDMSARGIAEKLSVSPNNVRDALRREGISLDKGKHFMSMAAMGRKSPRNGVKRSLESIEKQKATRKANAKPARSGYKHSAETIAKISAGTKGKNVKYTQEQRVELQRLRDLCKRLIRRILKLSGRRKEAPTEVLLGYSRHDLGKHLGPILIGHDVDHKVPVVEFFRRGIKDPAVINALPNLQQLPSSVNKLKSDTLPVDTEEIISMCLLNRRIV